MFNRASAKTKQNFLSINRKLKMKQNIPFYIMTFIAILGIFFNTKHQKGINTLEEALEKGSFLISDELCTSPYQDYHDKLDYCIETVNTTPYYYSLNGCVNEEFNKLNK